MRKQNPSKDLQDKPSKNPVAKFAHRFNKAQVYADKTQYRRKAKHQGQEPFSIVSEQAIEKGSWQFAIASAALQSPAIAA
ncbi:DUF7230 family protein [Methylomonas albis]|uniref:Transposase n=1 Tax=Methylomonas albis TaxID=1854563 RepID=A0ABR9D6M4_9GAMM|nr:hypothetical protein [Methylomonas albis]MBD9358713.1 hypothetical protein [Methylomonas albis]